MTSRLKFEQQFFFLAIDYLKLESTILLMKI